MKLTIKKMATVFLALSLSLILMAAIVAPGSGQGTRIKVIFADSGSSTAVEGPPGAPPFTANVTVTEVSNLYAWSIKLVFDNQILNTTQDLIKLPVDHVFRYTSNFHEILPVVVDNSTTGKKEISYGATLLGNEQMFSGSGTLCQINLTCLKSGNTTLGFVLEHNYTALATYSDGMKPINAVVENGSVTVQGGKQASQIVAGVDADSVSLGSAVTVSGTTSPAVSGVTVTIEYRPSGGAWSTLGTAQTNSNGSYSYQWTPSTTGNFEIRASWQGNADFESATSDAKTISVESAAGINPYIIVGVAVIIIVVLVAIYFARFRKPKK